MHCKQPRVCSRHALSAVGAHTLCGAQVNSILERAAVYHQDGELEQAVQLYKQVIKLQPHGEAYATLSKVLADQGKNDLSEKAMRKATKLHNEQLASWSLF